MSFHSYYSSSELSSSSHSNHGSTVRLGPQTTARIAREVRELIVSPESGVYLVVDEATGLPHNLQELTVRCFFVLPTREGVCSHAFQFSMWYRYLFLHPNFHRI
jgi:hypothetical protein